MAEIQLWAEVPLLNATLKKETAVRIQINTDESVEGSEELSARISTAIRTHLDRFSQHITRIEVHLSDINAGKSGDSDKRCLIEARLEGRQPKAVSDQAATLKGAYSGAIKKLQRTLESTLGRLNQRKGADTIRTGEPEQSHATENVNSPTRENKIMVEKRPAIPDANKSRFNRQDQSKPKDKMPKHPAKPVAVDRPGFDLGGSTGKTSAGTGLGIGKDASEDRNDRSLPGRRNNNK